MPCHSPVNDEYPTTQLISSPTCNLGLDLDLHVECLYHSRACTVEQMPVVRDITAAAYRLFETSQRMEQG